MAQILSPKTPLNYRPVLKPGHRDSLENILDRLASPLDVANVSMPHPIKCSLLGYQVRHYEQLATLLNECVQASHASLDADPKFAINRAQRWYAELPFVIVEGPSLHHENPTRTPTPTLAGAPNLERGNTLHWSPQALVDNSKLFKFPSKLAHQASFVIRTVSFRRQSAASLRISSLGSGTTLLNWDHTFS